MKNKLVVIGAGGTGGHIFPALTVAEELKALGCEVVFIGIGRELEARLIPAAGFELITIPFVPMSGGGLRAIFRFLMRLPGALRSGLSFFKARKPALVIGFGGYPSFIPMISALMLGIPRVLHEQNGVVGLANRFLSLIAGRVFAVTGATGFFFPKRVSFLPNPVRSKFYDISELKPPDPGERYRISVLGGSQGALRLNSAVLKLAEFFKERGVEVLHQTGERDYKRVLELYGAYGFKPKRLAPFAADVEEFYREAHLVICRAGAMTVAELCAAGRPAIFVPLPIAGGHQKRNVGRMVAAKAASMLEESEDLPERLQAELKQLFSHPEQLVEMGRKARELALIAGERPAVTIARAALELAH